MAAIVIFFGDAIALMFAKKLGLQNWEVCVAGALLMVICKVLKPKEASGSIPISMLLLIVGSQAMAGALSVTGAGEFIGGHIAALVKLVDGNSYAVGFIFFLIPFIYDAVYVQSWDNADFSSHCHCHLCVYRRESRRADDPYSSRLPFCLYDADGHFRGSLYHGMRRL